MKTLFTKSGLLILLTVMIISSCKKDFSLNSPSEKKILGQWKYDKVKFQKNFSFSNKNIIDDYKNLVLEFSSDYKLIETDLITGTQQTGTWSINVNYMYYGENSQYTEKLNGTLNDEPFDWDYLSVTKKKIISSEYKDGGTYKYTLVRY